MCEAFIDEISNSKSKEDLDFIRARINSNGVLTEVENAELNTRLNIKAKSFEKVDVCVNIPDASQNNGKSTLKRKKVNIRKTC